MAEYLGNFVEIDNGLDFLIISFSSTKNSIQERLRNNSLSANFLGDYWTTILPKSDNGFQEHHENIKHTINFIANELLDNAVKFNYELYEYPIKMDLHLCNDVFRFYVTNCINPNHIDDFKSYIQSLLTTDPQELYVKQVESNVDQEDETISMLGFLTMINDYDVKFAWKFYREPDDPSVFITIMAELPPIS
ncbi:hypothetical protein MHK_006594 [Candidatus Magnetomorum sp. HK-1]|nr:hypothetical protein MHK_006594 [Candidatus Magnetomorum sp. HK-1]